MDDLERRALLGVAGIGALAAIARAGPLNPPAGAIAPTGRTTDEIYNRIPAPGTPPIGAFDGRTPISTGPVTISNPGSYVLTANLSASGTVITIASDDVTLDLNGFTVTSLSILLGAITLSGIRDNITIRNGNIVGGSAGISGVSALTNALFEDVCVMNGRVGGINLQSSNSRSCVARRCRVNAIGSTTVASDGNLSITGMNLAGSCWTVEDCVVARLIYNGGGTPTFVGISLVGLNGNRVARCTVCHDGAIVGRGIAISNLVAGVYRDNTVINFSIPYTNGIDGGGNV
jgi:hypothetical protein